MDHFCPWVGGLVGEKSYKFFVQFNFYSAVLSAYTMSAFAYFVAQKKESTDLEVQWLIALGLSVCTLTSISYANIQRWVRHRGRTITLHLLVIGIASAAATLALFRSAMGMAGGCCPVACFVE